MVFNLLSVFKPSHAVLFISYH